MERSLVILFDGVCNSSIQLVLRYDKRQKFAFSALQGNFAYMVLKSFNIDLKRLDSIILLQNGRIYAQSSAALLIAMQLGGLWPLLYVFIAIPKFIRDGLYNAIAKNRYKWWGQQESCWPPTPELTKRFLS